MSNLIQYFPPSHNFTKLALLFAVLLLSLLAAFSASGQTITHVAKSPNTIKITTSNNWQFFAETEDGIFCVTPPNGKTECFTGVTIKRAGANFSAFCPGISFVANTDEKTFKFSQQ